MATEETESIVFSWLQKHYHSLLMGIGLILLVGSPIIENYSVPKGTTGKGELSFFIFMPIGLIVLLMGISGAIIKRVRSKEIRSFAIILVFAVPFLIIFLYLTRPF